jgi:class 3 adenylate cyclase
MHRGRVTPQIGLVIACKLMGVNPNSVRLDERWLTIPRPGADAMRIPVFADKHTVTGRDIGALTHIAYFGGKDWQTAWDPKRRDQRAHVPINAVWQVVQTQDSIKINNSTADRVLGEDLHELLPDLVEAYRKLKLAPADYQARAKAINQALPDVSTFLKQFKEIANPNDEDKKQLAALQYLYDGLSKILSENQRLATQLESQRALLHEKLSGKAVLIGSIASGNAYDLKPTPLHAKCPGVMVHGVVANGILQGESWRFAPRWITLVLTFIFGLATTALVMYTSPWKAALCVVGLALTYLLINGILLFDKLNIIVGVAGPMVVMMMTRLSCQLVEILVEIAERTRITRRFRAYVDPALVQYVVEHPEKDVMGGEEREMTVVFTDLAGFTTVSEKLKEKVVPLLNEYLDLMTGVIHRHGGYVNKFLGDGIMFFFNAPRDNPNHAADAAATVLAMQPVIEEFNKSLVQRGLPAINMRAGIATGPMIVGDAGGTGHSDYTVIGDNVNLSARLEGANKATGTKVLMTSRTAEMFGDRFVTRPVAKLQVKGKSEGVITCELLADAKTATGDQKAIAALSKAVFDHFVAGRFADCLVAVEELEKRFGESKFTAMYREEAEAYLKSPPTNGFDGSIVLTEK